MYMYINEIMEKTNYDCMLNVIYVSQVYTSLSEYNKNISNIDVIY